MFKPDFEPYHCHTKLSNCFTQLDSPVSIDDYAKEFKNRGHHTLCITEHGNRSDVWAQYELASFYSSDDYKMTPIAGAECYFVPQRDPELKDNRNFHLIVIAKDMIGYKQLNAMLSEANMSGFYTHARVDFELLSRLDYRHFLVTTACVAGPVRDQDAAHLCGTLHELFRENFFLEIQHHPQSIQIEHNQKILDLYQKYKYPIIYATDSHYIFPEEKIMREELMRSVKIQYPQEDSFDLHLPTASEAYEALIHQNVFSRAQIEEAMENTLQLRDFEGVSFTRERKFPIAKSKQSMSVEQREYLYQKMVCDGYVDKAGKPNADEAKELRAEMNTILETHSADYFVGLHDMLERGKQLGGILTTTSRGSACGFATNYALGFTSINRLHTPVKMYPDRFISKAKLESGSMPDVDSNISNLEAFEQAGREVFGEYSCYPMIAYGKLKALAAFKMLSRSRELDFNTSNEISKQLSVYELDRKHAIENNQDDPDYDVDEDIVVEDYVEPQYIQLVKDSKQYQNIITSISPHPCAHLVYHMDLREEIGVIRLKPKTGSKEPQFCVYIDGTTADSFGYTKSDLLRVDVVKLINDTFNAIGQDVLSADELVEAVKDDPEIWALYANGFTMGLNQMEKPKTTQRVMQFKPQNTVELTAMVAAIRPGAKSLVDDFVSRTFHSYDIPAMDNMLRLDGATSVTGKSSFLFYDEQVMTLAKAAGISPADANLLIKAIKKKKLEKVAKYKEQFIPGFIHYLMEKESVTGNLAEKTADDVWTVILNSASYLFNASHAYAMCLDSLYGAFLKCHYPYEFYATMLKLYTDKGNKEKIALIIDEMYRYQNIRLTPGRFGQDNRDWYIDKTKNTISQSLSSIKFIPSATAEKLCEIGNRHFNDFTSLLRCLQMETAINKRQTEVLIKIGYFEQFGKTGKLMAVFTEFFDGKNKLTKTVKSYEKRLAIISQFEQNQDDINLPIYERIAAENDFLGLCFSTDRSHCPNEYFILEVDDKYTPKIKLYNVCKGTSGLVKMSKKNYNQSVIQTGRVVSLEKWSKRPRYLYKNGKRIAIPDEYELWLESCNTVA